MKEVKEAERKKGKEAEMKGRRWKRDEGMKVGERYIGRDDGRGERREGRAERKEGRWQRAREEGRREKERGIINLV